MSLRNAFAAALQFVRAHQGLSQRAVASTMDQSHVSRLEGATRSVSLEVSEELAEALQLHPMSLLTLVYAAQSGQSPQTILQRTRDDLESLALLNAVVPAAPTRPDHPRVVEAAELGRQVSDLLAEGNSQAEVARLLGVSRSTITRHVQRKS
ncbi:helix-turn-helix domain-containing protein [Pseudomonas sp. UMAB-08]|uniref:helix-turn-helix domain-containing protein n=1 Tax=Pseudomonas sp. UMAB-08 TaxID=1365375 RepID=UPI001C5639F9|nr:helix-turn-helix domain-containing protein [Pseudomonas sp. UMAB-08]